MKIQGHVKVGLTYVPSAVARVFENNASSIAQYPNTVMFNQKYLLSCSYTLLIFNSEIAFNVKYLQAIQIFIGYSQVGTSIIFVLLLEGNVASTNNLLI